MSEEQKFQITLVNPAPISVLDTVEKKIVYEAALLDETVTDDIDVRLRMEDPAQRKIIFGTVFKSVKLYEDDVELTAFDLSSDSLPLNRAVFTAGAPKTYEICYETLETAAEGQYTLLFNAVCANQILASAAAQVEFISMETALFRYEDKLADLSEAEIEDIIAGYGELEALRQVVYTSITNITDQDKTELLNRYYAAADQQYLALKAMLLHFSKDHVLEVARVKYVGGNAPYMLYYRDCVNIGSASEAYIFYPEGYRAEQTGIANYPSNQPDSIQAALMPNQTTLAVGAVKQDGGYALLYKVGESWFRSVFAMRGGVLAEVNHLPVGNLQESEYVSALESAMAEVKAGTSLEMAFDKSDIDKSETLCAGLSLHFPAFGSVITERIKTNLKLRLHKAFKTGAVVKLFDAAEHEIAAATVAEDGLDTLVLAKADLISYHDAQSYRLTIDGLAVGECDATVFVEAYKEGCEANSSSYYDIASYTAAFKIADRRLALDDIIANTRMEFAGDVIITVDETLIVDVTTSYPVFSADLDKALRVDTLFAANKPFPIGAKVEVYAGDALLGSYEETSGTQKEFWLNDSIDAANERPRLYERSGETVVYQYRISGLLNDDYVLTVKNIAAMQDQFDSVDARYTLASKEIPVVVTDKTALVLKINEALALLEAHKEGNRPGDATEPVRRACKEKIDGAAAVRDDGDALRNEILTAITELNQAIADFKLCVIKWHVDKSLLRTAVEEARILLQNTTAGVEIGQTAQEAIDAYQAAYETAVAALNAIPDYMDYFDEAAFQAQQAAVDAQKAALDQATAEFRETIVSDVKYAARKVTEYETAAKLFFDSIRKKIRI